METWPEKIIWAFIALAAIIAFGLFGMVVSSTITNESNRITEGVVIDKGYSPTYVTYSYIKSVDVLVNIPQYHPERYSIRLQGEKNGKTVTYWRSVTAQEYSDYDIGDYYPDKGEWT